MAKVTELLLEIKARTEGLEQGLREASTGVNSFGARMRDLGTTIFTWANNLKMAASAASSALKTLLGDAIQQADAIERMAQITGIGIEKIQQLVFAVKQEKGSAEDLIAALKVLSGNLFDAGAGSEKISRIFEAMNISIRDAQGNLRNSADVLMDIANVMKSSAIPQAEKMALAQDLLGRSGTNLLPILQKGAAAFREHGAALQSVGGIVSESTIKSLNRLNDTWNLLVEGARGFLAVLADEVVPYLQYALDYIVENAPAIRERIREIFQSLKEVVLIAWEWGGVFRTVFGYVRDAISWVDDLLQSLGINVSNIRRTITEMIINAQTNLQTIWEYVRYFFTSLWGYLKETAQWVDSFFSGLIAKIPTIFRESLSSLWGFLGTISDAIQGTIKLLVSTISSFFSWAVDRMNPANWMTGKGRQWRDVTNQFRQDLALLRDTIDSDLAKTASHVSNLGSIFGKAFDQATEQMMRSREARTREHMENLAEIAREQEAMLQALQDAEDERLYRAMQRDRQMEEERRRRAEELRALEEREAAEQEALPPSIIERINQLRAEQEAEEKAVKTSEGSSRAAQRRAIAAQREAARAAQQYSAAGQEAARQQQQWLLTSTAQLARGGQVLGMGMAQGTKIFGLAIGQQQEYVAGTKRNAQQALKIGQGLNYQMGGLYDQAVQDQQRYANQTQQIEAEISQSQLNNAEMRLSNIELSYAQRLKTNEEYSREDSWNRWEWNQKAKEDYERDRATVLKELGITESQLIKALEKRYGKEGAAQKKAQLKLKEGGKEVKALADPLKGVAKGFKEAEKAKENFAQNLRDEFGPGKPGSKPLEYLRDWGESLPGNVQDVGQKLYNLVDVIRGGTEDIPSAIKDAGLELPPINNLTVKIYNNFPVSTRQLTPDEIAREISYAVSKHLTATVKV